MKVISPSFIHSEGFPILLSLLTTFACSHSSLLTLMPGNICSLVDTHPSIVDFGTINIGLLDHPFCMFATVAISNACVFPTHTPHPSSAAPLFTRYQIPIFCVADNLKGVHLNSEAIPSIDIGTLS